MLAVVYTSVTGQKMSPRKWQVIQPTGGQSDQRKKRKRSSSVRSAPNGPLPAIGRLRSPKGATRAGRFWRSGNNADGEERHEQEQQAELSASRKDVAMTMAELIRCEYGGSD